MSKNIDDIKFHNIIIEIPEDTVKLTVNAQIIENDKLTTIEGIYDIKNIFEARKDFLDNVELGDDYNAKFALTEKGRALLEELEM